MGGDVWVSCVAAFSALGAFLFGLDIGYIGPILVCSSFKRDVAHLPDWQEPHSEIPSATEGFIVGIFSIGCVCTSFPVVSGYFLDTWGRKVSIIIGAAVFVVGCELQASAASMAMMLAGRYVAGCSIGLLSTAVVLYQSELAPPHLRGALTSFYQLGITFGILVAAFIDYLFLEHDGGWRICIRLQLLPAVALLVGMLFLPRSPRWLVQKGLNDEALRVLRSIRGESDAQRELEEMLASNEAAKAVGKQEWSELFRGRIGHLLALGVTLQLLQQLCGMNAFMYFGPSIFRSVGVGANMFQTAIGGVNFFATFPAIYLADRCGRRLLLSTGAGCMLFACLVLGGLGHLFITQVGAELVPASETLVVVIVAMVFLFVACFSFSWGPMIWVYNAEIFPLKYRSRCVGVTTTANWVGNFMIAMSTPILFEHFGFGTFLVFGIFCFAALGLALWLPETKGVLLEHIGQLFDQKFGTEKAKPPYSNYGAAL